MIPSAKRAARVYRLRDDNIDHGGLSNDKLIIITEASIYASMADSSLFNAVNAKLIEAIDFHDQWWAKRIRWTISMIVEDLIRADHAVENTSYFKPPDEVEINIDN